MKKFLIVLMLICFVAGCNQPVTSNPSSDVKIAQETERRLAESARQVDIPNIKNWREKRLLKELYEKRDQDGLVTYTYIVDFHGKLHYLGQTIGYGLPYSTQFSNPEKIEESSDDYNSSKSWVKLPQAEPNGLFMPTSSSATWVMMKTDKGLEPQYIESLISVFTFKLKDDHPQVECNVPLYSPPAEK